MEIWRPIDVVDDYEVSSLGRVRFNGRWSNLGDSRRYARPKIRSLAKKANGYSQVTISIDGKSKSFYVHRLVASAFLPNPEGKRTVNHKDGNKSNNSVENLEWATHPENFRHAVKILGRCRGETHALARLTDAKILEIRASKQTGGVIARRFGVSRTHIYRIKRRDNWKHI